MSLTGDVGNVWVNSWKKSVNDYYIFPNVKDSTVPAPANMKDITDIATTTVNMVSPRSVKGRGGQQEEHKIHGG